MSNKIHNVAKKYKKLFHKKGAINVAAVQSFKEGIYQHERMDLMLSDFMEALGDYAAEALKEDDEIGALISNQVNAIDNALDGIRPMIAQMDSKILDDENQ